MKRGIITVFSFLVLTCFLSCKPDVSTELVEGHWKATTLRQKGKVEDLSKSDIWFKFNSNGTYEYSSNDSYKEAGHFYIKGKLLYTIDTLAEERIEKSVKLAVVGADSLHFDMNQNGVSQTIKLMRRD